MRFASDFTYGSSLTKEYIQLADSKAEYNTFVSNFSATKSIMGAINSNASTSTSQADRFSGSLSASLAAGSNVGANSTMGAFDLSGLTSAEVQKSVDVFINGQMMLSGSTVSRAAGAVDYSLTAHSATSDLLMSFDLEADDIVQVVIR